MISSISARRRPVLYQNSEIVMSKIFIRLFFVFCLVFVLVDAHAATLTYPGAAPCNTTLQACITGAASGDTIEIATNDRIDETLTVDKTLTLTSFAGFTGLIGSDNELLPNEITVENPGSGITIDVLFSNLNFDNGEIYVSFSGDNDHRFTLQDSILYDNKDHNNDSALDINVRVNSTVVIERNQITSAGPGINVSGSFALGYSASVSLINNEITGANPGYSYQGIQIRNDGFGDLSVDVLSNLIYSVGGCYCGSNSGLDIYNNSTGDLLVNVLNNTIWDVQAAGVGLYVNNPSGGTNTINFYNNTISGGSGYGIYLPAVTASLILNNSNNNFFGNVDGEFWNGYTPGAGNVSVDPGFQDAEGGDFRLADDSALIDAGTSDINGATFSDDDIFGNTRVIGDSVDIGAAEANTDLGVSMTSSATSLEVGGSVIYFITVSNVGADDSSAELSASLSAGELFFTSFSQGSCSNTATTLTCSLGVLSPGGSASVVMVVLSSVAGSITNSVSVTGAPTDIDTANNSATATTEVTPELASDSEDDDTTGDTAGDAAGDASDDDASDPTSSASGGGCSLINSAQASVPFALYGMTVFFLVLIFTTKVLQRHK